MYRLVTTPRSPCSEIVESVTRPHRQRRARDSRWRSVWLAVALALPLSLPTPVKAALLTSVSESQIESSTTLFRTEWKRDQNLHDNGRRGNDIFLRGATGFSGPNFGVTWGASGTSYNWAITYDGDVVTLTFGGQSRALDITPDGTWNAVRFFLSARNASGSRTFFDTSSPTLTITEVNGEAQAYTQSVTDGTASGMFALDGFGAITSMRGTMTFDFDIADGARSTPGSRLAINLSAAEVIPAPIPLPAGLTLVLLGAGMARLYARRQRAARSV